MKVSSKLLILVALFIASNLGLSQSIEILTYQIGIYDASGEPISNMEVYLRITIFNQQNTKEVAYQETQQAKTDSEGIVEISIGTGTILQGNYITINWELNDHFLQIEVKEDAGKDYRKLLVAPILTRNNPRTGKEGTKVARYNVGDKFGGGIIIFVDDTGEHGLITAPNDQSNRAEWGCNGILVGASNLTDGMTNTKKIVDRCGRRTAARMCDTLTIGGFTDWYLPSQYELNLIYQNAIAIGNLSSGVYCSSTEYSQRENTTNCWNQNFGKNGKQFYWDKNRKYFVRAIRKF